MSVYTFLHVLEHIDSPLGVSFPHLPQGFVLVTTCQPQVLPVQTVLGILLLNVSQLIQLFPQVLDLPRRRVVETDLENGNLNEFQLLEVFQLFVESDKSHLTAAGPRPAD